MSHHRQQSELAICVLKKQNQFLVGHQHLLDNQNVTIDEVLYERKLIKEISYEKNVPKVSDSKKWHLFKLGAWHENSIVWRNEFVFVSARNENRALLFGYKKMIGSRKQSKKQGDVLPDINFFHRQTLDKKFVSPFGVDSIVSTAEFKDSVVHLVT